MMKREKKEYYAVLKSELADKEIYYIVMVDSHGHFLNFSKSHTAGFSSFEEASITADVQGLNIKKFNGYWRIK